MDTLIDFLLIQRDYVRGGCLARQGRAVHREGERERDTERERRQRGGESEKKDGSEGIKDGIKRSTRRWREKVDL